MSLRIGTASWTDKTLIACGRFYPRGCSSAEARLRFYASLYPLVEVDASYYAMPSASNAGLWVQRTPADFVFNVKAFRLFTGHQTPPDALPRDIREALGPVNKRNLYERDLRPDTVDELWRRFVLALGPLREAGKLGAVHCQFPPWVVNDAAGQARVRDSARRLWHEAGIAVSMEFRHHSWFQPQHRANTLALLRDLGVVHTVVDGPQGFPNSVPALWEVTQPALALVRLHGRNAETWNIQGAASAADRFVYDYPDAELDELATPIRALAERAAQVHVIFNNCFEDRGQRNALALMDRLDALRPQSAGLL